MSDNPIRARTKKEQKAYMQGYVNCFNDIADSGWKRAHNHIVAMADVTLNEKEASHGESSTSQV
jgi:hypothetical protein